DVAGGADPQLAHAWGRAVAVPRHDRSRADTGSDEAGGSGLYDVRAGDLVVPALLVGIEGDPDDADEDDDAAEDQADVPDERIGQRELTAARLHDADAERAVPEGLPVSIRGPAVQVG